jgi:nucleoside phosphorylase
MRLSRFLVVAALIAGVAFAGVAPGAEAKPRAKRASCLNRILVLGAMPNEIGPLLDQTVLDESKTVTVEKRRFFVGRLRGHNVVLAMTGIGILNAEETANIAFSHFRCGSRPAFSAIVFSGVSGAPRIGDVTVPARWTEDGQTFLPVDGTMFATAQRVAGIAEPKLLKTNPLGDPVCACIDPTLVKTVELPHEPAVVIGGDGSTSDPFGGRKLPCFPNGGDVFGCEPCRYQSGNPPDVEGFATGISPFADPNFFLGFFQNPPTTDTNYVAQDMETAAVARIAAAHGTPFLAFRAGSDGAGDPLMLPGFPFQFFFYKELAAQNAAIMTLEFLQAYRTR